MLSSPNRVCDIKLCLAVVEHRGLNLAITAMKCHKGLARMQLVGGEISENATDNL